MKYNVLNTHLFSYLFHAKLIETELEKVHTQTKKRVIDMFRKDYTFAPITQNSYFSLCVIYNLSLISNTNTCNNIEEDTYIDLLMHYISHFNFFFQLLNF